MFTRLMEFLVANGVSAPENRPSTILLNDKTCCISYWCRLCLASCLGGAFDFSP